MLPIFNFFKRTTPNDNFFGATFDSEKLTLTLFKDGYPLCWAQENLTLGVVLDGRIVDKELFAQALNVCIERCLNQQPQESVGQIFFGASGNNVTCVVTSARQKRSLEEKITKSVLTNIYKEIEQIALNNALDQVYQSTGNDAFEAEVVLNETTYIKLDGAVVYNPIGQTGELLEVEVFNAYCSPNFIDAFEDVAKKVKLELGGIFPVQYLLTKKLKIREGQNYDATLMTVYADFTDISVVFGGRLIKTSTLPLGRKDLDRDLDFWMDGLELALLNFSDVKTFAHNVYICGGGLERTDFWEMLEWREWEEKVPFKLRPEFTKLDSSYFSFPQEYRGDLIICGMLSLCKELV